MSDSDIVQDFLVESNENLDRLDRDLVGLEQNPHDKAALAGVFHTIHTIKGTCGFLGFNKLEKVTHVGENLLTLLRDGVLTLNPEITTALLGTVDAVRQMLKEIQSTGQDGANDYPDLRETLTRLLTPDAAEASPTSPPPQASAEPSRLASAQEPPPILSAQAPEQPSAPEQRKNEPKRKPSRGKIGGDLVDGGAARPEEIDLSLQDQGKGDAKRLGETLVSKGVTKQDEATTAQPTLEAKPRDAAAESIRVGVGVLDKLMTLVG